MESLPVFVRNCVCVLLSVCVCVFDKKLFMNKKISKHGVKKKSQPFFSADTKAVI